MFILIIVSQSIKKINGFKFLLSNHRPQYIYTITAIHEYFVHISSNFKGVA